MTGDRPRVVVIGAGLVGRATAYFLTQDGADVTVVDGDPSPSATSRASLGVLTHAYGGNDALSVFYRDSLALHQPLAAQLQQETGIDVGWRPLGGVDVALTEQEVPALQQLLDFNQSRGAMAHWLDAAALGEAEPRLSSGALCGVLFPEDGRVDPARLAQALSAAAGARGAIMCLSTRVQSVQVTAGRVTCELVHGGATRSEGFDAAVVAAGAWTQQLLPTVTVRPVRGQSARLAGTQSRHILRWQGQHALPNGDGTTVVGGTVEDVGFELSTTAAAAAELADWAGQVFSATQQLSDVRAGLRPKPRQGRPVIDAIDGPLFVATGHYKNGVLMAPLTGQVVARWVLEGTPGRDMSPFQNER